MFSVTGIINILTNFSIGAQTLCVLASSQKHRDDQFLHDSVMTYNLCISMSA